MSNFLTKSVLLISLISGAALPAAAGRSSAKCELHMSGQSSPQLQALMAKKGFRVRASDWPDLDPSPREDALLSLRLTPRQQVAYYYPAFRGFDVFGIPHFGVATAYRTTGYVLILSEITFFASPPISGVEIESAHPSDEEIVGAASALSTCRQSLIEIQRRHRK